MQIDNDPKYCYKNKEFLKAVKLNIIQWETKLKAETHKNKGFHVFEHLKMEVPCIK